MLFSVLIPVYNVEKYIRGCIDSVLSQSEQDFEIILCDDGSTDGSGAICDEYQTKYPDKIRVIHKENEGLLLTRRRALKEAKGEWFVHLDSDDYMMPDSLAAYKSVIEKTENLDLIICKVAYGAEDGEGIDFYSKLPFSDGQIFEGENKSLLYRQLLLGGYMTAIYQKIARRDIVDIEEDYGKYKGVSLAEDHLQSLPLLTNSKKAIFLDCAAIYYRFNGESITKKKSLESYIKNIRSLLKVYAEEKKYFDQWEIFEREVSFISANHCRRVCGIIKDIIKDFGKEKKLKSFFAELNENKTWNDIFIRADRQTLGRFSMACYKLIKKNNRFALRVVCKILMLLEKR